jgi:hypothetical protein
MSPKRPPRSRFQRFAFGALEQLATIFGAITASVLTVGLFLPALNSISGAPMLQHADLMAVARLVLGFSACTAIAALVLRGLGRLLEDDGDRGDAP